MVAQTTSSLCSLILRAWLFITDSFLTLNFPRATSLSLALDSTAGGRREGALGKAFPYPLLRVMARCARFRRRLSVGHLGRHGRSRRHALQDSGSATPLHRFPLLAFSVSATVGSRSNTLRRIGPNRASVAVASRQAIATEGRLGAMGSGGFLARISL